jgi:hypothetical protein
MRSLFRLVVCAALLGVAAPALAGDAASKEAGKHFQRGVELYTDGDFRGALVEFKKAYATWPRANVLYDIGQTEYQLLDYAAALRTMERYLAETGANAAHRAEVEGTVEILRGRVGRVVLTADAGECDVTVDDQPAGTTPLGRALMVSVGLRKIAVTCAGRPPAVKQVEVSAGELVRVDVKLPQATLAALRGIGSANADTANRKPTRTGMALGWSFSAILVAATIGVASAALVEQNKLNTLRNTYPVSPEALQRESAITGALAISADVVGVAALTMIGVSTYLTVKYVKHRNLKLGFTGTRVMLTANF